MEIKLTHYLHGSHLARIGLRVNQGPTAICGIRGDEIPANQADMERIHNRGQRQICTDKHQCHGRRSRSPLVLTRKLHMNRVPNEDGNTAIPLNRTKSLRSSHQNSHSTKIKMAADLAALYLVEFIYFLAPQVGLEPTTLRLTAECSAIELLRSVLYSIVHYNGSRERGARQKNPWRERSRIRGLASPESGPRLPEKDACAEPGWRQVQRATAAIR